MKVIATLKSPGNDPVPTVWCGGAGPADDLDVMESVAQLLKAAKDESPWSPAILDIRIVL